MAEAANPSFSSFNTGQFTTVGSSSVNLKNGANVTNIQGVASNLSLTACQATPTNIYTATGTLSCTNNRTFMKGSAGAFSALHRGDDIVILGNNQYTITGVTNSNDTIGVYPITGSGTQLNIPFQVYPNSVHIVDINGLDLGGIGNGGSYTLRSDAPGNPGSINWFSEDGAHSIIAHLDSSDAAGPALKFNSPINGFSDGMLKLYVGAAFETLCLMPNSIVAARGLSNTISSELPVYVTLHITNSGANLIVENEADIKTNKVSTQTVTNTISSYNGNLTAGNGMASVVAITNLSAQSSSIGSTTLFTTTAAGFYRLTGYAQITTGGAASGALSVGSFWTDSIGSESAVMLTNAAATSTIKYSLPNILNVLILGGVDVTPWFFATSGTDIKYSTTYAGGTSNLMRYSLYLNLERL